MVIADKVKGTKAASEDTEQVHLPVVLPVIVADQPEILAWAVRVQPSTVVAEAEDTMEEEVAMFRVAEEVLVTLLLPPFRTERGVGGMVR